MATYDNINKLYINGNTFNLRNNSNWLNGSATGSVRTINSKAEDSSYTMGKNATAEGYNTTASGNASHAEGRTTIASGNCSHAEGYFTLASGNHSHAEGYNTTASGYAAHAEGLTTRASGDYQTVIGKYNTEDIDKAFIIGNGSSSSNRSNALTVDWNGNVEAAGTFYGKIPSAKWIHSSSKYLSVTTGTGYAPNQFTGYSHSFATNDSNFFESDANGIKVKKTGLYFVQFWGHINCGKAGNSVNIALYDYDDNGARLTLPIYDYQNIINYSSINANVILELTANHRIIIKVTRYSGSQTVCFSLSRITMMYLG